MPCDLNFGSEKYSFLKRCIVIRKNLSFEFDIFILPIYNIQKETIFTLNRYDFIYHLDYSIKYAVRLGSNYVLPTDRTTTLPSVMVGGPQVWLKT